MGCQCCRIRSATSEDTDTESSTSSSSTEDKPMPDTIEERKKSTYIILAPAKAYAGLPYAVSVNILEQQAEPVDVEVKITDIATDDVKVETKLEGLTFGKATTASLGIIPVDLLGLQTILLVKGISQASRKIIFEGSHILQVRPDSLPIFIQTDKSVYMPGDMVRFRVIVTKADLTPFKGFANIEVKDSGNVVIKEFKSLRLDLGVAMGALQLSDDARFGGWSVVVKLESENRKILRGVNRKKFGVKKYVLPTFYVKLDHQSCSTPGKDINVTVVSRYIYGKGVGGTAKIAIGDGPTTAAFDQKVTLDKMGKADAVFKYTDLEKKGLISNTLKVRATVKEESTGVKRDATGEIEMHQNIEKLVIDKQGNSFKPGMDYTFTISVVTLDNKPIPIESDRTVYYKIGVEMGDEDDYILNRIIQLIRDRKRKVSKTPETVTGPDFKIAVATMDNKLIPIDAHRIVKKELEDEVLEGAVQLDGDGKKKIVVKTPDTATALHFRAYYKKKPSNGHSGVCGDVQVDASLSATNSFILIETDRAKAAKVGYAIDFTITKSGNFSINNLTLQIINKGSIVFVKEYNSSSNKSILNVPITQSMAPVSQVVVYAVRSDNDEFMVDTAVIKVEGTFRNNVTVSIDPKKTRTRDDSAKNEATITVNTDPDSFVGILGMDQRLLLLKSGNDITHSEVERETERFHIVPNGAQFKETFLYGAGGKYPMDALRHAGLLVITDGYIPEDPHFMTKPAVWPEPLSNFRGTNFRDSNDRPLHFPGDIESPPEAEISRFANAEDNMQSALAETWIWFNSMSRANGKVEYKTRVPNTISSFVVSAFGINERTGLGVAATPAQLHISKFESPRSSIKYYMF